MKKADNFNASKWLVENKITTQSRLNEDEEEKKYYLSAKSKDGKKHEVFKKNPNYIKTTYDSALKLINSLKKPKHYTYYVSDIDGNPVDKNGNIINESRLNEDLTDEIAALPNHHTAEDTEEATLVVGKYAVVRYDESDEGGENMYVVWDNTVNQDEIGSYDDEPEFESTDPAEIAAFLKKNESLNEEASLDDVLSKEELIDRLEQVFGSEDMSRLNFFQKLAINMVKKQIISKIKSGQIQTRAGIKAALSGN